MTTKLNRMSSRNRMIVWSCIDSAKRNWFSVSAFELADIVIKQRGRCAICKTKLQVCDNKFQVCDKNAPQLDHCHKTYKVRGVLCRRCSLGLGMFKDNKNYLRSAIKYLKSPTYKGKP